MWLHTDADPVILRLNCGEDFPGKEKFTRSVYGNTWDKLTDVPGQVLKVSPGWVWCVYTSVTFLLAPLVEYLEFLCFLIPRKNTIDAGMGFSASLQVFHVPDIVMVFFLEWLQHCTKSCCAQVWLRGPLPSVGQVCLTWIERPLFPNAALEKSGILLLVIRSCTYQETASEPVSCLSDSTQTV